MSISKNVIRDLLPVYAAGEASEDTRALVAEACASDPELLAEVTSLGAVPIPEAAPPAEVRFQIRDGLSFVERVGFRYCVDKALRASAAAVSVRACAMLPTSASRSAAFICHKAAVSFSSARLADSTARREKSRAFPR